MKVAVFDTMFADTLTAHINAWLENHKEAEIIDIKFTGTEKRMSAMIIYKEFNYDC